MKLNKNLKKDRKKKKVVLKIPFEIDIKKTTQKQNHTKLSENWIVKKRIKKLIIVKNKNAINKDKDFLNLIDL